MPVPQFVPEPRVASKTAECLNTSFAADPNAIHALIVSRVPCNQSLADHPNVIVDKAYVLEGEFWQVTMLGVINGVLTANGLPRVATSWSDEQDESGRRKMIGFVDYTPDVAMMAAAQEIRDTATASSTCHSSGSSIPSASIEEVVRVIDDLQGWTPPFDISERPELASAWERASDLRKRLASVPHSEIAVRQTDIQNVPDTGKQYSMEIRTGLAKIFAAMPPEATRLPVPSITDLWEMYFCLELLRSEEASQIIFTSSNPDDNNLPNEVVGVKDLWTEWLEVDFRGDTLLECLRKAVEARKAWCVEKEQKRRALLPKT